MAASDIIKQVCKCRYMQWVDHVATCVLCKTKHYEIEYNPKLVGTFPRTEAVERPVTVAQTFLAQPYKIITLEDYNE